MNVIISNATNNKTIYHRAECFYEKRIKYGNRLMISKAFAESKGMCACQYCCGFKGEIRTRTAEMKSWEETYDLSIMYKYNSLYVLTDMGCWRIFYKQDIGKYILYHKNYYDKSLEKNDAIMGKYHRQRDVKETESLERLMSYISKHDKAKAVIMDDYKKLPQTTKAQKKYYRQAKNRAHRSAVRRVDYLFSLLESNDPGLKQMAFC